MRTVATVVYRLGDIIEILMTNAGTVLLTATLGLGIFQVFVRKAFGLGFLWAEDIFKYITLWAILLCTGLATRYMTHIRLDFLVRNARGKFQTVLVWSGLILGLATSLYLAVLSIQYVGQLFGQKLYTISRVFPKGTVNAAFTAACLLVAFYYLEQIVQRVYSRERLGLPPLKRRGRGK